MAPTPKLRAVLMGASALTVSVFVMAFAGQAAAQTVTVGGAAGSNETRNVGAGETVTGAYLHIGRAGTGVLNVTNGGVTNFTDNTIFGFDPTGRGTGVVTGAGSAINTTRWLGIGYSGHGSLTISNGGGATAGGVYFGEMADSQGAAMVTGSGSSLSSRDVIEIGGRGIGELTVADGATASAGTDVNIGVMAGSTGTTTITGAGSTLTTGRDLFVGSGGNGRLMVSAGGSVVAGGGAEIGRAAGSIGVVTVTGAGSTLTSNSLVVGGSGDGALTVSSGGTVRSLTDISIGGESGGAGGRVLVTGAGSSLTAAGYLEIGGRGNGALTVSNGAIVSGGTIDIAYAAGSQGTLNIGSASGAAATGAGTLNGPVTFGAGNGLLLFNHNSTGYGYTGTITGGTNGRIRFENGLTTFNTTGTAFTGVSDIRNGAILNLNGSLGGTLNVLAGGELRGVGTVGALNNAGTLNIGGAGALGVLNGASASFASGSTFAVDFSGASADRLVLTGAANIASGSILSINRPTGAVWRAGDRATFLTATGGLTGRFTLQNNSPLSTFLSLRDGYTATDAYLEVHQARNFAAAALTANQQGAAAGVQSLGSGTLFNAIANMPTDAAAQVAFDALSGELHPGVRTVAARDGYRLQQVVLRNGSISGERDAGARIWGEAWSTSGEADADGNAERLENDSAGFIAGGDLHIGGGWRLGATLGFDEGDVDSRRGEGHADLSRRSVLAYVDGQAGGFGLKGGLGYTGLGVETRRVAAFASPAGAFNETLKGDYDGSIVHVWADASYPFALGEARVAPFVNVSRVAVSTDAHVETGGLSALSVSEADTDLTFSTVGVRAGGVSFAGAEITGSAGWRSASGDRDAAGLQAFSSGADFSVSGPSIGRNAAVIDLGAEWKPTSNLSIGAGVSYVGGGDESDKGARLSLRYSF